MKETWFLLSNRVAFYKAFLDHSYSSLDVLKIRIIDKNWTKMLVLSDERDLFWLGVSYGIKMTFE